AIVPQFQQMAIDCEQTALLTTAPGHTTRCVDSAFVSTFEQKKRQLEEDGADRKTKWAQLEKLNLGRLRIASKGLERQDDTLNEVDKDAQLRDGLYMIGQVATLRSEVLTMAQLHQHVSEGATEHLEASAPTVTSKQQAPADVAIVGMSCVLPGAADVETFWSNIVHGRDAISEVPTERWDPELYFDADSRDGTKTPSKWGGFIDPVPFDPLDYGIPPNSLPAIEPVQLLSLEIANRALDDAGYADRDFDRQRTSVIFGAEGGTELAGAYGFRAMYPSYLGTLPQALDEHLPSLTEDSFPGVLANVIAGRIANRLDLGGANYTVDAACASSLAAVDLAVKELSAGTSDMVLCGGADFHNSINDYLMFASVHALSKDGRCKTFDSKANGIALGEGVAVVVLKRLSDAQRDGDKIYAVIRGIGASSDGRSLGLTAPRQEGQVRALERAYKHAGVSPKEVRLVEAHGTGTVVGDKTELATLTEVYTDAGSLPGSCVLGSVKSQIGHT
ncbi:MAG TPA: polyketide synthase, partial [Planctomycetes bacterium]|nr:polyketide synthase [Planctomycetota bacterium]